jgi:hypothetical protein
LWTSTKSIARHDGGETRTKRFFTAHAFTAAILGFRILTLLLRQLFLLAQLNHGLNTRWEVLRPYERGSKEERK